MNKIIMRLTCLLSFALIFMACSDNMGDTDKRLGAVKALVEPVNGGHIELELSLTAEAYFEWEYVDVKEGGTLVYQIAFDKVDGDFSNPLYMTNADNNGLLNHATISHKQLNIIAGKAGYGPSEKGDIKWTVYSSKGTEYVKSSQENIVAITRLAGFEDLPVDVFVTGEGSEGGTNLSQAQQMKPVKKGEFEVYTLLTAGQPYYFTDQPSSGGRKFYTEGVSLKEDGESTISTTGVYKIELDFNIGVCTYTLVTRMAFFFCPANTILFDLPYVGYGVFQAKDQTVEFQQEDFGRDERYKFRMFIREDFGNGAEKQVEWGTLNATDSQPNASSPASYYYLEQFTELDQWANKWKIMSIYDNVPATYTIYLQADQPYTHSISR